MKEVRLNMWRKASVNFIIKFHLPVEGAHIMKEDPISAVNSNSTDRN
jgi:hypothetical protein